MFLDLQCFPTYECQILPLITCDRGYFGSKTSQLQVSYITNEKTHMKHFLHSESTPTNEKAFESN